MVWWSRTEEGEEEDITRKGEEMRRVHREQPFHYSQANRRNDIRVVPFVSFGTKQLYALLTISTAFRPLSSFSLSLAPISIPSFHRVTCSPFACHFLPHFHPPSPLPPSPLLLRLLLLTSDRLDDTADRTN